MHRKDLYHDIDALLQEQNTTGKSKPKLVSGPIVRVIHQSIVKHRYFGNFNFYKVMYGERTSLALSVHLPYRTL